MMWQQHKEEKLGIEGAQRDDEAQGSAFSVPTVNIVCVVASAVFVLVSLFGPTLSEAMIMPLSQATPWAIAYSALEISLFTCSLTFIFKRSWKFAVPSFLFATFSAVMLISLLTVAQAGTW